MDGVHHHHGGLQFVDGGEYFFELRFGQHLHLAVVQPQAARAQGHLCSGLFARHIQGAHAAALQTVHGLQNQRRFTNAGVAANQHHTTLHHAAAQHTVEFFLARRRARHILRFDVGKNCHFRGRGQSSHACVAVFGGAAAVDCRFNQRVPRVAARAFAQPLRRNAAAVGTGVLGFFFGHVPILLDK